MTSSFVIPAEHKHAKQIALLHDQGLAKSFLRKLGINFLASMYRFFIKNEIVFVFIEDKEVKGFISGSLATDKVMRRFVFNSPLGVLNMVIAILRKPSLIKSIFETYSSSHASSIDNQLKLPSVELMSIVVAESVRVGGIGSQLLTAFENELKRMGVTNYKVIAGEKLIGANRFYLKNGFMKVSQITIHGDEISNVYLKTI